MLSFSLSNNKQTNKMTQQSDNQLQSKNIKESSEKLLPPSENVYICCFSEKW